MLALADVVVLSSGWRRRVIALGAGAFGGLALAPLNLGMALVVPMVVAVWLLDGCRGGESDPGRVTSRVTCRVTWRAVRGAFGAGWWLGLGYFVAGFWWLGAAFFADRSFLWALPLGVLGLPALLALFTACGFAFARLLWLPGAGRVLALALGLSVAEWARGHLFTGFPWNAFGMGLGGALVTAQTAALVGLDGLTWLTVALCAAPATLWDRRGVAGKAPFLAAVAVLAAIVGFGAERLARPTPGDVAGVVVRIMQPGLWPDNSFSPENKDAIVARYIALSRRFDEAKHIALADVTMLVWPESAFPFILTRDAEALHAIGAMLPKGTALVTGAAREVEVPTRDGQPAHSDYFNAMMVIESGGAIVDSYDKIHLVPFGEYLPFASLLTRLGLRNFVAVPGGFEPGTSRWALAIPGMPAATPLICYEAIFADEVAVVADPASAPRFLLNITNDGWFGLTSGPSQHFAQARLRTIEQGLPMVRGAATGISAIMDGYGRVVGSLALGDAGILDGSLPKSIRPSVFAKLGKLVFFTISTINLLFLLGLKLIRRCSGHHL